MRFPRNIKYLLILHAECFTSSTGLLASAISSSRKAGRIASSASRKKIQSAFKSRLSIAQFFCFAYPSHGWTTTSAPASRAISQVLSVDSESRTQTLSAHCNTLASACGKFTASFLTGMITSILLITLYRTTLYRHAGQLVRLCKFSTLAIFHQHNHVHRRLRLLQ